MNDSILTSIKKMLGIAEDYEYFDTDLIIHINSVFTVLEQLGVVDNGGFSIADKSAVWSDFIADANKLQLVKSYMLLKVKLLFDPPMSSAVMECYKTQISEYEWRLNVAAESDCKNSTDPGDDDKDDSDKKKEDLKEWYKSLLKDCSWNLTISADDKEQKLTDEEDGV